MEGEGKLPLKADDFDVGDRIIIVLEKNNDMDRGYVRFKGKKSN